MNTVRPGKRRRYRIPPGALTEAGGPFQAALHLGGSGDRARAMVAATGALAGHVALAWLAWAIPPPAPPPLKKIPVILAPRPPPPPPKPPEPPKPEPPRPSKALARRDRPPPRPSAAPKVVASKADTSGPADLLGFAMPEGTAVDFRGGLASTTGESKVVEEAPPPPKPPPEPSQARPAKATDDQWACAWPEGEASSDINEADVVVTIHVNRIGEASKVDVRQTVNQNFRDAARSCALSQHYDPELDAKGKPVNDGVIPDFTIHFVR